MFLIRAGFSLGLLVTLALLNKTKALPITTTLPPSIPRRAFLDPPTELVFKDNNYPVEFQDIGKRPLPQQLHENVKHPRGWSTLGGDFYDPNFRVETNNVYYNFNEHEGFYPDDEYFTEECEEEEINHIDLHSLDSKVDQHNKGYTNAGFESDVDTDIETDLGIEESDGDRREGLGGFETLLGGLIGGLAQLSGGVKPTQKPTPKTVSPANTYFPSDFEADTIKNADMRAKPLPPGRGGYNQFAYQPNLAPPPLMYPMQQPQELKRPQKDSRLAPQFIEEPVVVDPDKPIFSRTTTVIKTTSWYVNNNNELVLVDNIDTTHLPLKVKYEKTSKTSSTGPTPPYLQSYEDVFFHEENEKGRTIIEKLSDLEGLNPTAITSYTNSPSLLTTEFHEEVFFEEYLSEVKNMNNEFEIKLRSEPIILQEETCDEELPEEPKQPEELPEEPQRSHFFIDGKDAPINIDDIENSKEAVYEEPTRSHFFIDGGDKLIDIDTIIEENNEKRAPSKPLSPSLPHSPPMPLQPHPQSKPSPEDSSTLKNQPVPHLLPPHPAAPPHPSSLPPPSPSHHPPSPSLYSSSPPPPPPPPLSPSPPLPPLTPSPPHPPSPSLPPPPSHSPPPHHPPSPLSPPPPHPASLHPPSSSPHLPPQLPPSPPTPEASFPHQPSVGPKFEPNHNQVPGFNHPSSLAGQHSQLFGNLPQKNNWELMGQRRPEPENPHRPPEHPDPLIMKDDNRQRMEMRPIFPNRPNPNRPGVH